MAKKAKIRVQSEPVDTLVTIQPCTIDGLGTHIPVGRHFTVEQLGGRRAAEIMVRDGIMEFTTAAAGE